MTKNNAARRLSARDKVRTLKRSEIMQWYLDNNFQTPPDVQCEDKKAYKGKVLWWLDPPIPNSQNPVLIEEEFGGQWTLRIEIRTDC